MTKAKKPPVKEAALQRQQEILAAALKVFSQKGFKGATTREIAALAGVAEGTIFRYFKTKKDILISLFETCVVKTLADTIGEVSDENEEIVLRAILKNRLKLVRENISLIKVMFTEAQFHPEIREQFVEKVVSKAAGIIEQFIAARVSAGAFREIDPRIATRMFVGMAGAFIVWKEFLQGDKIAAFEDDPVIDEIVQVFLHGLVNKLDGGKAGDEIQQA